MRFKRVNYSNMMIEQDTPVKKTYVTLIQNNKYQKVNITPSDCRKSVKFLSEITEKTRNDKC